ncbi:MAG TPA: hypothetical protein VGG19_04610 [Tepidisphaeraceae bacterium]|jgi:filamentous hemagglutinin
MRSRYCVRRVFAAAIVAGSFPAWGASISSTWTNADGTYLWSDPLNWSPNTAYPDNNANGGANDYTVTVGAPDPTTLDVIATVDSLTITADGELFSNPGSTDSITTIPTGFITNAGAVSTTGTSGSLLSFNTANLQNTGLLTAAGSDNTLAIALPNGSTSGTINNTNGDISAHDGNVQISDDFTITGGTFFSHGTGAIMLGNDTLSGVTLASGAQVAIGPESSATIDGPTLSNDGTITIDPAFGVPGGTLTFNGSTLLTGSGTIVVNGTIDVPSGDTLTQQAGQTIQGFGTFNGTLINSGVFNATGSLNFNTASVTNTATIESTAGTGDLLGFTLPSGVSAGTIDNTGGTIDATGGSQISIGDGFTITGGTIQSTGSSTVEFGVDTLNGVTVAAGSQVLVNGDDGILTIASSTFTDNGTISENPVGGGFLFGTMNFSGNTTLTGSGTIDDVPIIIANGATLTQDVNHTIEGRGTISGSFINNGTVNANSSGNTLAIENNLTNTSTLEATGGGTLQLNGSTTNSGSIFAGASSTVIISGPLTNTGSISTNGGSIQFNNSLTNNGTILVDSGDNTSIVAGQITGTGSAEVSGSLTVNSINQNTLTIESGSVSIRPRANGGGPSTINQLTLSGTGTLDLSDNSLTLPYTGTSPLTSIQNDIASAYDKGKWDGAGITTSAAATHPGTSLGIKDTGTQVLVQYTWYGDANLDGVVNLEDLTTIHDNLGKTGVGWSGGDFNYDGIVNADDVSLFQLGDAEQNGQFPTELPEPSAVFLLASLAAIPHRRRRNRHC